MTERIDQVLREWPPGYGGVERVAHELASAWGGTVHSFDVQSRSCAEVDALPVTYERVLLPCTPALARLRLPLPSRRLWKLLRSKTPLHGHLPSPGVLLLLLLARLCRPRRCVSAHWHCFLEPDGSFNGALYSFYQWLALRMLPSMSQVVTTSPSLAEELIRSGCAAERVRVLPCSLSAAQEAACLDLQAAPLNRDQPFTLIFIGRLDSYKRLDWLLQAMKQIPSPWCLEVVGDGPRRRDFQELANALFADSQSRRVHFHGRVDESAKQDLLARSQLLVLPSDRCNEAFGIVQLEAMAAGLPVLAFQRRRSGMGWVGALPDLEWDQTPQALPEVLKRLAADAQWRQQLGEQARERYLQRFARAIWLRSLDAMRAR